MNVLNTTPITDTARFPFKKGTLDFMHNMQNAFLVGIAKGMMEATPGSYNEAAVYRVYGCGKTVVGSSNTVGEGMLLYQDELFFVDSVTLTLGAGEHLLVGAIATTQYTTDADPVTLSDNSVVNVHNIRKLTITKGSLGTGIWNFDEILDKV